MSRSILTSPFRFVWAMIRAAWFKLTGIPVIAPGSTISERTAICDCCPHEKGGICQLCNCVVAAKTLLSVERCPDYPPRWKSVGRPARTIQ